MSFETWRGIGEVKRQKKKEEILRENQLNSKKKEEKNEDTVKEIKSFLEEATEICSN